MTFYQTISDHYDAIFPLQPAQVEFVHSRLPAHAAVLDVGCATGSLGIALSALNHDVTGIDLSSDLVQIARRKAASAKRSAVFHQMDMNHLSHSFQAGEFNGITCMGNTLSHLPIAQVSTFLNMSYQLLADNGLLIFQIVNHDRLLERNLSSLPIIDNPQIRFERNYRGFDGKSPFTFHAKLTVKFREESFEVAETLHPHGKSQLRRALTAAGFNSVQFFGNYLGAPAGNDHMPLIAVATH